MSRIPLVCSRMAMASDEFCELIDNLGGPNRDTSWISRVRKMLPRLHIAVIALMPSEKSYCAYRFPDDDQRCELYMRLHRMLQSDHSLNKVYGQTGLKQQSCERLADDLTDMYFDLRFGLDLLPVDPVKAADMWQCSFYVHWSQHLLDAECRLRAVESGVEPLSLPRWNWPGAVLVSA